MTSNVEEPYASEVRCRLQAGEMYATMSAEADRVAFAAGVDSCRLEMARLRVELREARREIVEQRMEALHWESKLIDAEAALDAGVPVTAKDVQGYVVGFALDTSGRVALIRKNRPAWQAGKLNGIGGHIETGEQPLDAMRREFVEETGTALLGWLEFVVMDFPGARIHFYRAAGLPPQLLDELRTTTDERVEIHEIADILDGFDYSERYAEEWDEYRAIPNLSWLLPLAVYTADTYEVVVVRAAVAEVLR